MKKAFNQLWSVWDKTDRFVAVISVIGIILFLCITFTSCAAPDTNNVIHHNPYDVSQDEMILDNYIPLYPDGVIGFIYCTQDQEYIVEYMDYDVFDIDNIPHTTNCANGDSVVCLYCSETVFFEFLEWYNNIGSDTNLARNSEEFYAASDKFYIKEVWCSDSNNSYWYYKIEKK